jgi:hypothetical protein
LIARVLWPLEKGQPIVRLYLREPRTGILLPRTLLADTGAGSAQVPIELVLSENDVARFGERGTTRMVSSGAIRGEFPTASVWIELPTLDVSRPVAVMTVPFAQLPQDLDGIVTYRFLNSFTFGNFGDKTQFGLET